MMLKTIKNLHQEKCKTNWRAAKIKQNFKVKVNDDEFSEKGIPANN